MTSRDEEFLAGLRATFRVEAREHLGALAKGLAALRHAAPEGPVDIVEAVFREAHTLKGAARAVSLPTIESVSHALESAFAALKRGELAPSTALVDALLEAVDRLTDLAASSERGVTPAAARTAKDLVTHIGAATGGAVSQPTAPSVPSRQAPPSEPAPRHAGAAGAPPEETVRIPAARLSSLFSQTDEILGASQVMTPLSAEFRRIGEEIAAWRKRWTRTRTEFRAHPARPTGPPQVAQLLEFYQWSDSFLRSMERQVGAAERMAAGGEHALASAVGRFRDDLRKVLLLPASSLFDALPRLVRDLCRDRGKEAELVVRGAEVRIDRRVLDELKAPLIHLLRNCVDHGMETPDVRERAGKPRVGAIGVTLTQRGGGRVEIAVTDDGSGVDLAAVRAAAVRLGVALSDVQERSDPDHVLPLMFESGVSTSPIITEVSGRGLGLAIVREKIERLGGTVSCATRAGIGTTIRLLVPLSLSAFRGLFVRAGASRFVFPTNTVERVLRVSKETVKTVENRATVAIGGEVIAVVALEEVLELRPPRARGADHDQINLVVLRSGGRRIAFSVDEILHEQEVLLRGLGVQLARVRNVAGATALPTGEIVPVLYVADLVKSAVRVISTPFGGAPDLTEEGREGRTVLVVEDSITARALLRNVLESSGFDVRVAVDGIDALTTLKTEVIDVVVSDVDMPRMNGFDLTARIRADSKLAELPVILVTALDSREDRERGVAAGANAYIVKSNFDQGNLLEIIRRLT